MSSDVAQTDPLAGATGVNVALTSRTGSRSGCEALGDRNPRRPLPIDVLDGDRVGELARAGVGRDRDFPVDHIEVIEFRVRRVRGLIDCDRPVAAARPRRGVMLARVAAKLAVRKSGVMGGRAQPIRKVERQLPSAASGRSAPTISVNILAGGGGAGAAAGAAMTAA